MITKLKYGLKNIMIYEKFEVQIVQAESSKYEILILQVKGYSMDDPFFYQLGSKNTLREAREIQSDVFMYMMDNDFRDVKKSYFRMN